MAYVYNKYVVPNFSFIYLNEAFAVVLKLGVSQYSQETHVPKSSFL